MKYSLIEILWCSLFNQHLLEPTDDIDLLVRDTCGVQAQYLHFALQAIKARHSNKEPYTQNLIRTWTVRGTLHLISETDYDMFIKSTQNEWFHRWSVYLNKYLSPNEREYWRSRILELIKGGIRSKEELSLELKKGNTDSDIINIILSPWGGILKDLAYQGKIIYDGLLNNKFKEIQFKAGMDESESKKELLLRYISSYGPATVQDFAYWSQFKISESKALIKEVRDSLSTISDVEGNEYYYVPQNNTRYDCPIPRVIYLISFDPLLLAYKDKRRFLKPEYNKLVFTKNGYVNSVIIYDGQAIGIWKKEKNCMHINLFHNLSAQAYNVVKNETYEAFRGEIQDVKIAEV